MAEQTKDRFAGIQFVDQQEREYFAQAQLGEEAIQFLHSNLGRYLHGCAQQEVEALRDELEKIDPDRRLSFFSRRKLRRLQKEAQAARYFMRWLAEAIQQGNYAFNQLETYRNQS